MGWEEPHEVQYRQSPAPRMEWPHAALQGANRLTAGHELTFKLDQAGTFFLEVHSGRHSVKPGKFSLSAGYYEGGQTVKQVPRTAVKSPPWRLCLRCETHLDTVLDNCLYLGLQGAGLQGVAPKPAWYFCISNLQHRDTLSLRLFQCKQ